VDRLFIREGTDSFPIDLEAQSKGNDPAMDAKWIVNDDDCSEWHPIQSNVL
jgi:hypothetical protein